MTEKEILEQVASLEQQVIKGNHQHLDKLNKLLSISIENQFQKSSIKCYLILAFIARVKNDLDESFEKLQEALRIATKINDLSLIAETKEHLSSYYGELDNYDQGISLLIECIQIREILKQPGRIAHLYTRLGQNYRSLKEYAKAEEYLNKALTIIEDLENYRSRWYIYYCLGQLYHQQEKIEKAITVLTKALKFSKDHYYGQCICKKYLADCHFSKQDFAMAHQLIDESIALGKKHHINNILPSLELSKITFYSMNNNYIEARAMLDEFNYEIKQPHFKMEFESLMSETNASEGNFESALKHFQEFHQIEKELYNIESKKHVQSLEAQYQNELKEREKEILRLQKVAMQQKALRAQLNPHFFFNALISIQNYILDKEPKIAVKFLQNFSDLMRQTLENSEEEFISLEDEIEFLTKYLSVEQLRFKGEMQFTIEVDDEIETEFIDIPTMLIQPYVENAIKHGVKGIANGKIKILFNQIEDDLMQCVIEDNGRGRDLSNASAGHQSMGTRILKDRIISLNQRYNKKFESKTIDLKDEHGNPSGTRVEITLPEIELDIKA